MTDTTYTVPAAFWMDHVDRGCRCSEACPDRETHDTEGYGERTSRGYRVTLSDIDAAELLSDARHYSDATSWAGPEYIGLQSSARATVRRLTKDQP